MTPKTFQERLNRWFGPAFQRPPDPTVAPEGAEPCEKQARRALRWYAPSWRDEHGEELVATVLDAAPDSNLAGVDKRSLPRTTRFDLALGGLRQRRRARPSFIVRRRIAMGQEPPTWEGLAWLRDTFDQHGYLARTATYVAFMSLFYAIIFTLAFSPVTGMWAHGFGHALRSVLTFWPIYSSMFILITRWGVARHRRRAIKRAGLNAWGWPLGWYPSPPPRPTVDRVWAGPPAIRWVVGELRLALAACVVGGTIATGAAYWVFIGNSEPAKPLGIAVAPHISDLAWLAFLVAAACLVVGTAIAPRVVARARRACRPEGRPRSLTSLPLTSKSEIPHHIPRSYLLIAAFFVVGPTAPVVGWAVGALEVVAIPMLIALLPVVRRIERETGVAVHQRQVAAAIGGRFWSDEWAPDESTGDPRPA